MCLIVCLVLGALSALVWALWGAMVWGIILSVLAVFFLACGIYFIRARHLFSDKGAGLQEKVLDALMARIDWDGQGEALDVGCGSGLLAVRIAQRYPQAKVKGIDYWGKQWEYSRKQCEINAAAEGVGERTAFAQDSAVGLHYPDERFDVVVSNLVFHEVRDARDKREPIRETLRVLKKGGVFALQDLFQIEAYYGKTDDLIAFIRDCGVSEVRFEDTSAAPFIPAALKLPFMLGTVGILYGVK